MIWKSREFKTGVYPIFAVFALAVLGMFISNRLQAQDGEQAEELGQIVIGEAFSSSDEGSSHFVVLESASVTCANPNDAPFTLSDDKAVNVVCFGASDDDPDLVVLTQTPLPEVPTAESTAIAQPTATISPTMQSSMGQIRTYTAEQLNYGTGFVVSEDRDGWVDQTLSFHNYVNTWIDIPIEDEEGECFTIAIRYAMGHEDGRMMALSFGESSLPVNFPYSGGWGNYRVMNEEFRIDASTTDFARLSTITLDEIPMDGARFDWIEVIPACDSVEAISQPVTPTPQLNRSGY